MKITIALLEEWLATLSEDEVDYDGQLITERDLVRGYLKGLHRWLRRREECEDG